MRRTRSSRHSWTTARAVADPNAPLAEQLSPLEKGIGDLLIAFEFLTDSEFGIVTYLREDDRKALVKALKEAEVGTVIEMPIDNDDFSIIGASRQIETPPGTALVLHIAPGASDLVSLFYGLNRAREFIFGLGCRVLLCLRPREFKVFAEKALDLFNWNFGVYDLGVHPESQEPLTWQENLERMHLSMPQDLSEKRSQEELKHTIEFYCELLRELEAEPKTRPEALARARHQLGLAFLDLGDPESALDFFNKTLDVKEISDEEKAAALGGKAWAYEKLGKWGEAIEIGKEALNLYRSLASADLASFLPRLIRALNNVGAYFGEIGEDEQALTLAQEAVQIGRLLSQEGIDSILPQFAMSLNNLGNQLGRMGQHQEALDTLNETVDTYRRLATEKPEQFSSNLALFLSNQSKEFGPLQKHEKALSTSKEAFEIYQKLAEPLVKVKFSGLAICQTNLGSSLCILGRFEEAVDLLKEAVNTFRKLADEQRDRYLPFLATSLISLGSCLNALGHGKKALEAKKESLEILTSLMYAHPKRYPKEFTLSLFDYIESFHSSSAPLTKDKVFEKAFQTALDFGLIDPNET